MKPLAHFIASLALAALLYPVLGWKAMLIFAGGVLIDIDHYLWYVYKYRKIGFFKAYRFFSKNTDARDFSNFEGILLLFHTVEFLLVSVVLSFYSRLALAFTAGLILHYGLDTIYLYRIAGRFIVNHSLIHWIYSSHIKKLK
ncbi:hypothetical protein HYX08_01925 [Candidatus Woesearchaeota archaeon]|nr:hypothetical protein [Candidatus Woesearchaeota archaeon]